MHYLNNQGQSLMKLSKVSAQISPYIIIYYYG